MALTRTPLLCALCAACLAACEGGRPPASELAPGPPSCARAYDAIALDLQAMFASTGAAASLPPREAWLERCEALGLEPEALACLEPQTARTEDGCAARLGARASEIDALAAWFAEATTLPAPSPAPAPSPRHDAPGAPP